MARVQNKYKTLDSKLKIKEDRKVEHISGWAKAINAVISERKDNIQPSAVEVLISMYDFEFFSGNTIQKKTPVSAVYAKKILFFLSSNGYIVKAFGESEIKVSKVSGKGESVHKHTEKRRIRERYRYTKKAVDLCEKFLEYLDRYSRMTGDVESKVDSTPFYRNKNGNLVKNNLKDDKLIKPMTKDGVIYYEEEANVDKWYHKVAVNKATTNKIREEVRF